MKNNFKSLVEINHVIQFFFICCQDNLTQLFTQDINIKLCT